MKKLKYLMFTILLIIFIMPIANAKKVASCTYSIPFETEGTLVDFTISVNDDGSLEYNPKNDAGIIKDDAGGHTWYYTLNSFSENIYKDGKVLSECPKVVAYRPYDDNYILYITDTKPASNIDTSLYYVYPTLEGKLEVELGEKVDRKKEKTICERNVRLEYESNVPLKIRFYIDNQDRKKFEVTNLNTKMSGSGYIEDGFTLEINTHRWGFLIDEDNIDNFYKSKSSCLKSSLYLDTKDGYAVQNVYLTAKEPIEENNAGLNKDGRDYEEDAKWNPDSLCGEDNENCNIDITQFCTDPYIARTLKFLGLLLAIAKILVPALIIGLGFVDLAKIVISGKMEDAKKQGMNIIKRVVIGIVIFIIPTILITVYNVAYSIANDSEEVTEGELPVPRNFKNCVGCILDANNEEACIVNTGK